jgi:hypothetical protein
VETHSWLKISSERIPYNIKDISVIIPSSAHRYENRWRWFWPQYLENTNPEIVENTYIPCDEAEYDFLEALCPEANVFASKPQWIVPKTIHALNWITTRLTFRLANDIAVIRPDWETPLLERFNAEPRLQLIAKMTHGSTSPDEQKSLEEDWWFIREKYKDQKKATACVYPHGAILLAQTAVWAAYYSMMPKYTMHAQDDVFFGQLAQADGTVMTNMTGLDRFLCHVGISNKDFDECWMKHIEEEVAKYDALEPVTGYKTL